jgi:apolipoprotein N-acyltransferase
MKRWMLWGAGVVIVLMVWRNLAMGEPVSAIPLMVVVFGVEGAFFGAVGKGLWEIGRALVRVVRGEGGSRRGEGA